MSLFSFNFRPKRLNELNEDKENVYKPLTQFSMRSEASIGSKQQLFEHNMTPIQRSVFGNKFSDSAKSQKAFEMVPEKSKHSEGLTIHSTVQQISEDSHLLKQKISEELERIETFKTITEMEINRQSEEIKSLKSINDDLENRLIASQRENSELVVKLNVESTERQGVLARMNTTRDMFKKVTDLVEHIEDRFEALNEVKDAMDLVNENRTKQLSDLTQLYCDIEWRHKTIVSQLQSQMTQKTTEINVLNETLDRKTYDIELNKTQYNKDLKCFAEELNQYKELKQSLELSLHEKETKNKTLTQMLSEIQEKYEELIINSQKKDQTIDELKTQIESIEQKNRNFEADIQNKNQSIVDLENEISGKTQELVDLLSEKTNLLQLNVELNSKVMSIENERQESETSFQTEKHSIICEFEKTITEMETNIETLCEEKNQLIKWKEENLILIDELESKANQSMVEKETIEQQLKNDLKELRDEFDNKMNDFSVKIEDLEKRIHELTHLKEQNETTINEMLSETEVLRLEKEDLKQKLEKEERTLDNQMSNMSKILESCKSDYNKRIEDKEDRIKEYRRENERMRISIDHLTKKCERLEAEKQLTNSKLQELTLCAMRPTTTSPNRVLTPKIMSPIESTRLSGNRSSSPFVRPSDFSPKLVFEDSILSAKQELQQNLKIKSQNSQSSQSLKKVPSVLAQKDIKTKVKNESKQMAVKGREIKKLTKLNDSNSSESVYEVIGQKIMKTKKGVRKQKDSTEYRIDSPVKVNMTLTEEKVKDKKDNFNSETDEYDIEKVDKEQPFKKKMKTIPIKTYGKKGLRTENIVKGRPTPTKSNDLSWLNF